MGRQRDVGEELCRGGGGQIERRAPQVGVLLAQDVGVQVLEHLVEAELAESLHRVADGGGRPATRQTAPHPPPGWRPAAAAEDVRGRSELIGPRPLKIAITFYPTVCEKTYSYRENYVLYDENNQD